MIVEFGEAFHLTVTAARRKHGVSDGAAEADGILEGVLPKDVDLRATVQMEVYLVQANLRDEVLYYRLIRGYEERMGELPKIVVDIPGQGVRRM